MILDPLVKSFNAKTPISLSGNSLMIQSVSSSPHSSLHQILWPWPWSDQSVAWHSLEQYDRFLHLEEKCSKLKSLLTNGKTKKCRTLKSLLTNALSQRPKFALNRKILTHSVKSVLLPNEFINYLRKILRLKSSSKRYLEVCNYKTDFKDIWIVTS